MTNSNQDKFKSLVAKLKLDDGGAVKIHDLRMVLMPMHFFRYILREVHKAVDAETFRKIYWQAGYDGAVSFCESFQRSHQCTPREAVQGYLDEMSIRGWGQFSIQSLNAEDGTMEVLIQNSALVAEGDIPSGNLAWEGAMLGSVAFVQKQLPGKFVPAHSVQGREVTSNVPGKKDFQISVTPAPQGKG